MRRWILIVVACVWVACLMAGIWPRERAYAQTFNPGPSWTCSLDNIGATLTLCIIAPTDSTKRYITDIVAQSTTATAGQFILRTGTGTNCGTGTASLFPSAATVIRYSAPGNGSAPTVISFRTPLEVPKDKDLCMLGVGTNTVTMQIQGFLSF